MQVANSDPVIKADQSAARVLSRVDASTEGADHSAAATLRLNCAALSAAERTAHELRRARIHVAQLSVASGAAGRLLMEASLLATTVGSSSNRTYLHQGIARCLEGIRTTPLPPGLFSGVAGVAWTLLAVTRDSDDADVMPTCRAVSAALLRLLQNDSHSSIGNDLIDGLAGIIVFASEYARRTEDCRLLERASQVLLLRAVESDHGYHWPSDPRHLPAVKRTRYPNGCVDYGVAHGQVGIAASLSQAALAMQSPALHRAASGALEWLLASARRSAAVSYWPAIAQDSVEESVVRPSWCYGDIGACIVSLAAANRLGDTARLRSFQSLLMQRVEAGVPWTALQECSLCHGVAGALAILLPAVARSGWGAAEATTRPLMLRAVDTLHSRLRALESQAGVGVSEATDGLLMGTEGCVAAIALTASGARYSSPLLDLFVGV